jgi:transposase
MISLDISRAHLHYGSCRQGGKTYRSYSLARSFRKNGKVCKEILFKLGKLSDSEVLHWKMILKSLKGKCPTIAPVKDLVTEANYDYLDIAVLFETWKSWGLEKPFHDSSNRDVPLWKVVATLVISRCVNPCSKSMVATWFRGTALPFLLEVDPDQMNPSRIFRELSAIEERKPEIGDYLYHEVARRDPKSMASIFYDLSSSTFSGTRCVLMDWGYCKEGFENHIVLALVVNKKGLPVYWQVLPGCTADVTTIELLMRNLKDRFNPSTTTMVFDRGMVSESNLLLLEQGNVKYISAMDRNQIAGKTDFDFKSLGSLSTEEIEERLVSSGGFCKLNAITYYREVTSQGSQRRYILCFNPQLRNDQMEARKNGIERFRSEVRTINQELLYAKKTRSEQSSLKKFIEAMSIEQKGYITVRLKKKKVEHEDEKGRTITIMTYQGIAEVDREKLDRAGMLDGFWMLVTNQTEKDTKGCYQILPEEAITPYKEKVIIESAFRDIKSFLDISPIHVWTIEHVKAHYTVCVLAYLLDRTLTLKLHEKSGQESDHVVSHAKLYEALESCLINRVGFEGIKQEVVGLTRPTSIQIDLLRRLDCKHLIDNNFIQKSMVGQRM